MQKDEDQGSDLFEDLAEKTLQWEPASEKPRNSQSITSRGWLLSLESSITAEVKVATLMRRIEALLAQRPFTLVLVMINSCHYSLLIIL